MKQLHNKTIQFFRTLSWDSMPQNVRHEAKRAILDVMGCLLAGLNTPLGKNLYKMIPSNKINNGATMIGGAKNLDPVFAAMANSYLCNALDADDGHRISRLHSGAVIIPAAFAALEDHDKSGKKFIEAIVCGYEIAHRVGIVSRETGSYFGSAYGGAFGAAVASAWLMGQSPNEILNTMGVVQMQAPNSLVMGWVKNRQYPMVKEGMGWGAASGLMSAMLSNNGITGSFTIFSEDKHLTGLGSSFEISRVYFKPYPACRWTHVPLQALFNLMEDYDINSNDVVKIDIHIFKNALTLDSQSPRTIEEAQYSIPFVIGSALLDKRFGLEQICEARLSNSNVKLQSNKISLFEDKKFSQLYPEKLKAKIVILTKDGHKYSKINGAIKGDIDWPLSDEDLEDKFLELSQEIISLSKAKELATMIWNLEKLSNMKELINLFYDYASSKKIKY